MRIFLENFFKNFQKSQKLLGPNIFGCQQFYTFVDFYTKMYRIKF